MSWLERLRKGAAEVADKLSEKAEQAARYVAEQPGLLGDSTAEMLAERDWRKAHRLAQDGVDASSAPAIIELLEPHLAVDGNYGPLIGQLLGRAYQAAGRAEQATAAYQHALALIRDPETRRATAMAVVEFNEQVAEELELDLLLALASTALTKGDYAACIRWALQARALDERALTAYYLEGAAMLQQGFASDAVAELFFKALMLGEPATVRAWVAELIPDKLAWFESRTG